MHTSKRLYQKPKLKLFKASCLAEEEEIQISFREKIFANFAHDFIKMYISNFLVFLSTEHQVFLTNFYLVINDNGLGNVITLYNLD